MKYILLVRHPESSKNTNDRFAAESQEEALTIGGQNGARHITREVVRFADHLRAHGISVCASPAARTAETARLIADQVGCQLVIDDDLTSIVNAATAGRSFAQLAVEDAVLAREMNLYRAGVYSSYMISKISKNTRPYEAKVWRALESISRIDGDLTVVVAHQSFITFALIQIARIRSNYPLDFFGVVHLELGSWTLLSCSAEREWAMHFVNIATSELNTMGRLLLSD